MAKGRDHEIVGAPETHPKAVPWNTEIEIVWTRAFKCSLKTNVIRLSNQMPVHYYPLHVGPSVISDYNLGL